MNVALARRYRCNYHPTSAALFAQPSESGVLPFVQILAANAEHAARIAQVVTGCIVDSVERIDDETDTLPAHIAGLMAYRAGAAAQAA